MIYSEQTTNIETVDSSELLACPFCRNDELTQKEVVLNAVESLHFVECDYCLMVSPAGKTEREAANYWNGLAR